MSNEPTSKQPNQPLGVNSSRPVGVPPPHAAVLETFTTGTPPVSSTYNTLIQISSSTGALPPPAVVAGYEQILPGSAAQILAKELLRLDSVKLQAVSFNQRALEELIRQIVNEEFGRREQ